MFTIIIVNDRELILNNKRFQRTCYSNSPKQYTKIRFFVQLKIKAHVIERRFSGLNRFTRILSLFLRD